MKYSVRPEKDALLCVRYYPASGAAAVAGKPPIILVHGLMQSADIFDLPGSPQSSLAQRLRRAGHDVYTYDQRGAGDSQIKDWQFGLRENALIDLPSVIAFALERSQSEAVILGGYGLGGLFIFLLTTLLLKFESSLRNVALRHIDKIFALASPGVFLPRKGRRQYLYSRGLQYAAKRSAIIDRADFLKIQIYSYDPSLNRLLPKTIIRAALRCAQSNRLCAAWVKNLPLPTGLYRRGDFDAATFMQLLRSQALHRTARQLYMEILASAQTSGKIEISVPQGTIELPSDFRLWQDVPLLLFSSCRDESATCEEVKTVAGAVRGARLHIIDDVFTGGCGHWGYLFHRQISEYVSAAILQFVKNR